MITSRILRQVTEAVPRPPLYNERRVMFYSLQRKPDIFYLFVVEPPKVEGSRVLDFYGYQFDFGANQIGRPYHMKIRVRRDEDLGSFAWKYLVNLGRTPPYNFRTIRSDTIRRGRTLPGIVKRVLKRRRLLR